MRIKSNTPLSDNELRQIAAVLQSEAVHTVSTMEKIADIIPYNDISIIGDTLFIGKPPWDIAQEITLS